MSYEKLWGGRFADRTAPDMSAFNDSLPFDQRLYAEDIRGSIAWANALVTAGILTDAERDTLVDGLELVHAEFASGSFVPQPGDEDIHTAVERRLGELVGGVAGKLHTGRSRNDQIATDLRLYCDTAVTMLNNRLRELQAALVSQAAQHATTLMPGYTHLQRAQPITFGHWCLAYVEMLNRDRTRLEDAAFRQSVLPLGSGALAGNSLGIDRMALGQELGFKILGQNSLDAVSDRDFVAELLFIAALIGSHLSRMAEDLIIYSSSEFGFVELADAYSTGSSLMPQKKNPDSMELLRGKSGRLTGNLLTVLMVLKGLPLAYNKDMQEDKEPLFDSLDTLDLSLRVAAAAVATMHVNSYRMQAALESAMLATDLADELVRRGMPFREAHNKVGQLVRRALALQVALPNLPLAEVQAVQPDLDADSLRRVFDWSRSVDLKNSRGGTAPLEVAAQVIRWQEELTADQSYR